MPYLKRLQFPSLSTDLVMEAVENIPLVGQQQQQQQQQQKKSKGTSAAAEYWKSTRAIRRGEHIFRLLEKTYFINDAATKFASVSIRPSWDYAPMIEIGHIGGTYLTLNSRTWALLVTYTTTTLMDQIDDGISYEDIAGRGDERYLRITTRTKSVTFTMEQLDNIINIKRSLSTLLTKYEESREHIKTFCKSFDRNAYYPWSSSPPPSPPTSSFLFTMLVDELKMYPAPRKRIASKQIKYNMC
jgi:hypothetical protein